MLGHPVPRRQGRDVTAGFLSDLLSLRQTVMLCESCQQKLPYDWARRWEYSALDAHRGSGLCDYCQQSCIGTLWLPEEGGYAQETRRFEQAQAIDAARKQALAVSDRRRVRL